MHVLYVPGRIYVNKGHFDIFQKIVKGILRQNDSVHSFFLVHFFQRLVVFFPIELAPFTVAPRKDALDATLVQLLLVHIARGILSVRSEGVPHVHRHVIALQVKHGNAEIQVDLRIRVLINGNARDDGVAGKGGGFAHEQNEHNGHGRDAHARTKLVA
jgi:hypothetical protein